MNDEKIQVRVTSTGQTLDVVVLNKRLDMIQVVLGEGVHNVRCNLVPTRNGSAYVQRHGGEIVRAQSRQRRRTSPALPAFDSANGSRIRFAKASTESCNRSKAGEPALAIRRCVMSRI
jgi:hypothetical protein